MRKEEAGKHKNKDAMKNLRNARKMWIESTVERVKIQKQALKAITKQLEKKTCTIPEIAALTGLSKDKTLWYVASLKKYGQIAEEGKQGSYYLYALTEEVTDLTS